MSEFLEIRIKNWDEYNPRKDLKNPTWFRLDADIVKSRTLFGMSLEEKWGWVALLSIACKKYGQLDGESDWIANLVEIPEKKLLGFIETFKSRGLIELTNGSVQICTDLDESVRTRTDLDESGPYITRHNVTNTTNTETSDPGSVENLRTIWNTHKADSQPECRSIAKGSARYRKAQARLKEESDPSYWENVVRALASSSWHTGETSTNGWTANFDFLIKPDTHIKATEGQYKTKKVDQGRVTTYPQLGGEL